MTPDENNLTKDQAIICANDYIQRHFPKKEDIKIETPLDINELCNLLNDITCDLSGIYNKIHPLERDTDA